MTLGDLLGTLGHHSSWQLLAVKNILLFQVGDVEPKPNEPGIERHLVSDVRFHVCIDELPLLCHGLMVEGAEFTLTSASSSSVRPIARE